MSDPVELARDALRRTGARVTLARVRVLAELIEAGRALSHHDLDARFREPFDRVTLYRVLDWLVEQGLAHRAAGEDRTWRYMAGGEAHGAHAHFHCSHCGRVICLAEPAAQGVRLPKGYRSESVDLTVHGRCANCPG